MTSCLLLYSTLGQPDSDENCLQLGVMPSSAVKWGDVRVRSNGLLRLKETCFVWTHAEEWAAVDDDSTRMPPGNVFRIKLLPEDTGPKFILQPTKPSKSTDEQAFPTKPATTTSTATITASSLFNSFVPSDVKTDKVLQDAADAAKKMSNMMGATFSSWAKTATETVKNVNDAANEKKIESIGQYKVKIGKRIAEGGFSEVFIARGLQNEPYALKLCRAQTPEQLDQLKREVRAHDILQNEEFILQLLASDVSDTRVRFLFPLCEGGSWIDAFPKAKNEEETLRIFLGASRGLLAMHRLKLLHRDVKPHNILLTGSGHPLLMDLGSSCPLPIKVSNRGAAAMLAEDAAQHCSASYRAPELYDPKVGKDIGGEADVWSMGCTLFAVTYGKGYPPYEDPIQGVLKLAILNGSTIRFSSQANYSPFLQDLIKKTVIPETRMSLEELIKKVEERVGEE